MIQILLIHNKLSWSPITWLSYGIRVVTCSKWNHIAIRIKDSKSDRIIESVGTGVTIIPFSEWEGRANRIVLPLIPKKHVTLNLEDVLFTEGEDYGFGDLLETLKRIKAERWDGGTYVGKDRKGLLCSDLASILLGIPKNLTPADFANQTTELGLIKGSEYRTTKL